MGREEYEKYLTEELGLSIIDEMEEVIDMEKYSVRELELLRQFPPSPGEPGFEPYDRVLATPVDYTELKGRLWLTAQLRAQSLEKVGKPFKSGRKWCIRVREKNER